MRAGAALAVALVLGAAGAEAASGTGHASPAPSSELRFVPPAAGSYALPAIQHVDDRVLVSSEDRPAPLLGLAPGEAALVSFVYLSCAEACPLATATLHHLDAVLAGNPALGERVQLVTVSFDPGRDTPEALAHLRKALHPKGRWRFLTAADPMAIAPVLEDFGQDAVWIPDGDGHPPDRLRHVLKLFLVDDAGAVRNIYSTGFLDVRILLNDLETVVGAARAPGDAD